MEKETRFVRDPKVNPKLGHGKGTILDALGDLRTDLHNWAARTQAGQRLLIVGPGHRSIKRAQKVLRPIAKAFGLQLRYRFSREVKAIEMYVAPEMLRGTSIEYQMWVLVTAKAHEMTEPEKRSAVLELAVKGMQRDEAFNPTWDEMPEWTREMELPR